MVNLEFLTIQEQSEGKYDVPFAPDVSIDEITKGDKDPMFVTIEALNDEKPSSNGRFYDKATLELVAQQVNELKPDAYQGHLEDKDRPYKNPESQTIWLGAKVFNIDGVNRLFIKGYVLPSAKTRRSYLKSAKAVGKRVYVSIYGQARELFDKALNAKRVLDLRLESIDWARSGGAGINTLGTLNITREMNENIVSINEFMDLYIDNKLNAYNKNASKYIKNLVVSEMSVSGYTKENADSILKRVLSDENTKAIIFSREINPQREINSNNSRTFTEITPK